MLWFKRWYHEKFVSRTSCGTDPTLPDNVNKSKSKRKVIRIIYDGCNCTDDAIVCCHRNKSYWFIQRQLFHRSIDSIVTGGVSVDVGSDKNENNNFDSPTAIEATELVQTAGGKHTQVTDNRIEHAVSHIADNRVNISCNVQSIDIDVSNGSRGNFQSTEISSVTDVNKYGNGERSGSLSKSKEPRLRTFKLSIVPKINCSNCHPRQQHHQDQHYQHPSLDVRTCYNDSISNRIQIQYDNGIADIDEWPPKPFQQIDFLQRRIKELEYFISEIENRVNSDTSVSGESSTSGNNSICSKITSTDTNPSNAQCRYCDEQPLTDWVIVSIESKFFTKCENFPSDDHPSSSGKASSSTLTSTTASTSSASASAPAAFVQYYTTSEISDKRTIITVHQYQSSCALSDRKLSSQTDYGHNCTVGRLLCICKLLNFNNIQTGTPSIDHRQSATEVAALSTPSFCQHQHKHHCQQHDDQYQSTSSTMKFSSVATSLARDFHSTDSFFQKDPMYPEFNYLMPEPCTSSKHSNMLTAQMIHTSLSSTSSTIDSPKLVSPFTTPIKFCSSESIPEYFGLNECGDIIIHVDHICEETGFGLLVGRKKKIYCDVPYGEEVCEKPKFSLKYAVKRIFKAMSDTICKCTSTVGHPRNKTATNGPGDSIAAYALSLAQDPESTFSRNIENFIACTKDSRETSPQIIMRNMRQFMSGMKNYLVKHGEGDFQQEVLRARSMLKPDEFLNLDTILEGVMHQLVVLPLREHLYNLFVDYYKSTGDIQLLAENVKAAVGKTPTDFGIRPCIQTPSPTAMQRISLLILRLQEAELPLAKLDLLLSIVTSIIESTANTQSHALGADDFLPLLVYIVAKCGFIGAEIEAEFMWCLLQPSLLNGEAGYYLTALCSAVHVLKSFITNEQDGTGSVDFRSSSLPACSSVLRVIIPDEYNGSLQTRTLPIRPHTTTREVCRIIAHKARVTNPQDYALFKLVDGQETLLLDSDCPQEARLAARGKPCMLAYKRIEAKIAWPTTSQAFQ